jgi:hypothetical protein
MTEDRKYAILFLLPHSYPHNGSLKTSKATNLNEQCFIDGAIKKAVFVLERIDHAFPGGS